MSYEDNYKKIRLPFKIEFLTSFFGISTQNSFGVTRNLNPLSVIPIILCNLIGGSLYYGIIRNLEFDDGDVSVLYATILNLQKITQ